MRSIWQAKEFPDKSHEGYPSRQLILQPTPVKPSDDYSPQSCKRITELSASGNAEPQKP